MFNTYFSTEDTILRLLIWEPGKLVFITLSYVLFLNCYGKLKDEMGDTSKAIDFDLTTV